MRASLRTLALLAAIVALGGGLRLAAMEATFPMQLIGDEIYYGKTALQIARGHGHVDGTAAVASRAWRPPAHAYLLSLFADPDLRLTEFTVPAFVRPLILLQVWLGTALVALVALLGRALFGERNGLLAGCVAALYPALIAHSHYLWSETLFAVLVTSALLGVVGVERLRSWSLSALTGLTFGLAALTREAALPVAGAAALWWMWTARPGRRRAAAAQSALMLGLALLAVLPWTIRNYAVLHRFIPVATVGWYAAGEGNTLETSNWLQPGGAARIQYELTYFGIPSEEKRLDYARQHTFERIAAEQPTWIFKKTVRSLAQLMSPDSVLLFKLRRGSYGELPGWIERSLEVTSIASYTLVLVAGVLGIAAATGTGSRLLPCLVFGVLAALHILANATPRFRVPWMPLLMVYASHAALNWRTLPRVLSGRGWIAPAAVLLFFFGVCFPYFFAFGGRH
jgi:4-amino-4-deoxy-L-arabinose transferase-like glycosyltransferase